tara:strand:+ start:1827 stop:2126 length:300 start_codon:yes stop_codon:yes gene_type:complete
LKKKLLRYEKNYNIFEKNLKIFSLFRVKCSKTVQKRAKLGQMGQKKSIMLIVNVVTGLRLKNIIGSVISLPKAIKKKRSKAFKIRSKMFKKGAKMSTTA